MNRLFILRVGVREEFGLISPGELPDVEWIFKSQCAKHGMKTEYSLGVFSSDKNGVKLTLTIGEVSESFPSRMLEDALEDFLTRCFGK